MFSRKIKLLWSHDQTMVRPRILENNSLNIEDLFIDPTIERHTTQKNELAHKTQEFFFVFHLLKTIVFLCDLN